jgi:hypothetical protein
MAASPKSLSIRAYHVGFGDCFLLSFEYAASSEKHVLVDFGSTGLPKGTPKTRMMDVAKDIQKRCGGQLTAVVATHRHKDHISGFETKTGGKGTGDVIRALTPKLVVQPWTEEPGLAVNATAPKDSAETRTRRLQAMQLSDMQDVARHIAMVSPSTRYWPKALRDELAFIGEDNINNPGAVKNLMTMAKNEYVHAGATTSLNKLLPGVKTMVLGPPTVKQSAAIRKQASSDASEFWQFQANALNHARPSVSERTLLFPKHVASPGPTFPVNARWLIAHARAAHGEQTLQIVRMLDKAMNNTSVILLFKIGESLLLFPGDAQKENWSYALSDKTNTKLLAATRLYKVGHHGSRNATPKSLWNLFTRRSTKNSPERLRSVMSTMAGKHGSADKHTEVPRATLVSSLKTQTELFSTEALTGDEFYHDVVVPL